ncbi:MAG: HPF/RaiA family ribosome-associated protein [Myxococcales bacterium]|nr:HPF/RaiA family ribosome-associated protein [Myxococcales bacterium]
MNLEVTFKNLRPRDELRARANALYAKLERFLDPSAQGTLVVNVEHGAAILELVVTAHGETHTVTEEDEELRTALDKLFHTMEMRLRRHKERRVDRARRGGEDGDDGFVAADSQ